MELELRRNASGHSPKIIGSLLGLGMKEGSNET